MEIFPRMTDRPDTKTVVSGGAFWPAFLVGIPFVMSLLMEDVYYDSAAIPVLYSISFAVVGWMFRQYLKDSFLQVQCYPGRFCAVVSIAAFFVLTVELVLRKLCWNSIDYDNITFDNIAFNSLVAAQNILPLAEAPLMHEIIPILVKMPVWMTLCMSVFVPVVMCCLYYGVGFAPVATERPWLGYIIVLVIAAIPRLIGLGNTGYPMYQLMYYLLQLPWHLCACWAYQKADTIWAPICMYAVVNLLTSLGHIVIYGLLYF